MLTMYFDGDQKLMSRLETSINLGRKVNGRINFSLTDVFQVFSSGNGHRSRGLAKGDDHKVIWFHMGLFETLSAIHCSQRDYEISVPECPVLTVNIMRRRQTSFPTPRSEYEGRSVYQKSWFIPTLIPCVSHKRLVVW